MGTAAKKLTKLKQTKSQIQRSITEKGVVVSDTDTFASYADKIREINGSVGGGVEELYKECGFEYVLENGTLQELARRNHEETKDWVNYGPATRNKRVNFIPLLDIGGLTIITGLFYDCSSLLTIPLIDTQGVESMTMLFHNCSALTTIPLINTQSVKNMQSMFNLCSALITIPQLETRGVSNMSNMFSHCINLTTIPLLDTSMVNNTRDMFLNCSSLTNLGGFKSIQADIDLRKSTKLTVTSLLNVMSHLYDLTGRTSCTLTIGEINLAKLTDEQKAIALNKNWILL